MGTTFGDRLKLLLTSAGWTQGDLGSRLNISQSAISQWLSGAKSPASENLARIAAALGASQAWLEAGKGEPPSVLLERARETYAEELRWGFRPEPDDGARDYGNANLWSLPWDIDTLVREAVQNILDVLLDSQRAEAEFRIIRLKGSALDDFLTALKWEGDGGLKSHVEAAADTHQKLSTVLRNGLGHLRRDKELLLLCVEDRGTMGLIGDEVGEGNFAALTRNNLDSSKQRGTAGGSYGLGKAVFWRASQFATVLFHSRLSAPVHIDGEARDTGRFIGRVELPWHQVDQSNFAGPGWYGRPDANAKRVSSVWNQRTLLNDLHLTREGNETGTSIMVVGFNDASSDKPKEIDELRDDISQAIALNFWPALCSGRLTAIVSTWEGRVPRSRSHVDVESHQRAFANALRRFKENEFNDRLIDDGDVVVKPIPLDVPKRLAPERHGAMRHEAMLIVRRDSEEELDDLSSHLAVYRGREMVISNISLKHVIPGSTPFRAMLLCGEAAGSTDADRAAERFLRTAEPPAHNEWKSTPELKAEYAWGANARIKTMLEEAKRAIRDLVRPAQENLDDGPRELKELLKLSGPPEKQLFPRISRQEGTVIRDKNNAEIWSIQIGVRPPDSKPWRIQPALKFAVESGGDKPVPWTLEAVERCTVTKNGWVNIPAGMREAVFRGNSDPSGHPVPAKEAAVTVSIRSAERQQGGTR